MKADAVKLGCFNVYVERKDKQGNILMLPKHFLDMDNKEPSKGYCKICDAYPSTLEGERREEAEFVTLETVYGPHDSRGDALSPLSMGRMYNIVQDIRITQIAEMAAESGKVSGLVFEQMCGQYRQASRALPAWNILV